MGEGAVPISWVGIKWDNACEGLGIMPGAHDAPQMVTITVALWQDSASYLIHVSALKHLS